MTNIMFCLVTDFFVSFMGVFDIDLRFSGLCDMITDAVNLLGETPRAGQFPSMKLMHWLLWYFLVDRFGWTTLHS